jgi:hypothetical protein
MHDLISELGRYERSTTTLRLSRDEAWALLDLLAIYPQVEDSEVLTEWHERARFEITDRLAHEMEVFRWMR